MSRAEHTSLAAFYFVGQTALAVLVFSGCASDRSHMGATDASSMQDTSSMSDASTDGGAGGVENTSALCSDGVSNDDDAYVDCDDRDCCDVVSTCAASTYCGRTGGGGENTLPLCSDSADNDGDVYVDCEDRDCCAVRTDCSLSTYCGTHPVAHDVEAGATACMNGTDDDTDGHADCEDVGCCSVLDCEGGTACNPNFCLDGTAEVYQRMLPATTESGPAYTETVTTSGVGSAVSMDIGSMHARIHPRSAATPYTTTCTAFLGDTMMDLDCAATITQQIWSASGATTAPCGHFRGELRISNPTAGWFSRYVFSQNVPFTESGAELMP